MPFCHECGSEIAEEEQFCPHCGISLRRNVVEPEESEAEAEPAEESLREESPASAELPGPETERPPEVVASPLEETAQPVPDDEFVDISALKDSDTESVETEEDDAPSVSAEEPEAEPVSEPAAEAEAEPEAEPVSEPAPEIEARAASPAPDAPSEPAESIAAEPESVEPAPYAEPGEQESAPEEEPVQAVPEPLEPTAMEASAEEEPAEEGPAAEEESIAEPPVAEVPQEPAAPEIDVSASAAPPEPDIPAPDILRSELPEDKPAEEDKRESLREFDDEFFEDSTLIGVQIPETPKFTPEATPVAKQAVSSEEPPAPEPAAPEPEQPVAEEAQPEPASEPSGTTPNMGKGDTDGSNGTKLKPLEEGIVLNDRYEIVRKIGGGGMGAVYLASDKNLGGVLRAVKEMIQSYIEEEQQEKAVQDFKRESMLLTSLDHPSIPTIYDYFFDEQAHRFYLVMKYISGGDLAARLRSANEGRLDEMEVVDWAIQIADVLDYLHNRQPPIVYRDLKPANIMLDGNSGKVMLIDFGIARWVNKEEKGVTAVGTMGYAPPELFSGNVVPSSDIYSLGSTMFHLLTGADPQNNPLLIFDFQKNPRPRQINPALSDQIERIIMRAVEYNAEGRFESATEMRDSLTRHLEDLNAGRVTYGVSESPKAVALSDQPVFCGFCGQKIVATDMFCAFCGAKQPLAQPGVHSQEYNLGRQTAKLIIEGTSQLEYPAFELAKDENLVGRRDPMSNIFPEVDLSKFDPQTKISRKHARIWREGDNFLVEDLGSSNGTMLVSPTNESVRLIPHKAEMLKHGDKIRMGDTTLQFLVG